MKTSNSYIFALWVTIGSLNGYEAWNARGTGWALVSVFTAALCVAWALRDIR